MALVATRVRRVLRWIAILVAPLIGVGWAVSALYPDDWRPVDATVGASRIESVRYGTLQWALRVDTTYEVAGRVYRTTKDAFRNTDRTLVEEEAPNWLPGRKMRLYYDVGNPGSTSLVPDGGREATVATAVMLTPMFMLLAAFIGFVLRGRFSRRDEQRAPTDA